MSLKAIEHISKTNRLFVSADGGFGKTAICYELLAQYCSHKRSFPELFTQYFSRKRSVSEEYLPLYVNCRKLQIDGGDLKGFLERSLTTLGIANASRFLSRMSRNGRLHFLIDGLDEIEKDQRKVLLQRIDDLTPVKTRHRVTVFGRPYAFRAISNGNGFEQCELEGLRDSDRHKMFVAYCRSKGFLPRISPERSLNIKDRECLDNPQLYSLLLQSTESGITIGHSKLLFLRLISGVMLDKWHSHINLFDVDKKEQLLKHLARVLLNNFAMLQSRVKSTRVQFEAQLNAKIMKEQEEANEKKQALKGYKKTISAFDPKLLNTLEKELRIRAGKVSGWNKIPEDEFRKNATENLPLSPKECDAILDEVIEGSGIVLRQRFEREELVSQKTFLGFSISAIQSYYIAIAFESNPIELIENCHSRLEEFAESICLLAAVANDSDAIVEKCFEYDPITAIQACANAGSVSEVLWHQLTDSAIQRLSINPFDVSLRQGLGTLASRTNALGIYTRDTIKSQILKMKSGRERVSLCFAFACSNTRHAVAFFGENLVKLPESVQALTSMGDIAIDELLSRIDDREDIVEALIQMRSLTGIIEVVKMLTSSSTYINFQAAFCLASLMTEMILLDAISVFKRDLKLQVDRKHAWIVDRTAPDELVFIATKVTEILMEPDTDTVPMYLPNLQFGSHFAIPFLCILQRETALKILVDGNAPFDTREKVVERIYKGANAETADAIDKLLLLRTKLTPELWQSRHLPPQDKFSETRSCWVANTIAIILIFVSPFAVLTSFSALPGLSGGLAFVLIFAYVFGLFADESRSVGIPMPLTLYVDFVSCIRTRNRATVGICTLDFASNTIGRASIAVVSCLAVLFVQPVAIFIGLWQWVGVTGALTLGASPVLLIVAILVRGISNELKDQNPFHGFV